MKKGFSVVLITMMLLTSFDAKALLAHEPFFDLAVFDIGGAISRALQAIIKFFLGDDNKLVAELVYDGGEGGSCGGNGGAYTGDNGNAIDGGALKAVASTLTDIPAESEAYPEDIKVADTSIGKLADLRTKEIMKGKSSLDELTEDRWAIEYRAQQRSIQAMTDALVMKKAYSQLIAIANSASEGSYSNYSEAASTVATRRLMLDALFALRKRVVAARVRARAETMELDIDTIKIPTQANLDETALQNNSDEGGNSEPQNTSGNDNTPVGIQNYGLTEEQSSSNK